MHCRGLEAERIGGGFFEALAVPVLAFVNIKAFGGLKSTEIKTD